MYVPKRIFLTKGVGRHSEKLTSFELALRQAEIANLNLVRVSSVFPPGCKVVSRRRGLEAVSPGQIAHAVVAEASSKEPYRLIAASVGLAIPSDPSVHGYLSEHHGYGMSDKEAGDYAEDLAADMLATTLGIEFDPDESWDARREIWKISDQIVKTRNITQSAVGDRRGRWTTTIAAAILLP